MGRDTAEATQAMIRSASDRMSGLVATLVGLVTVTALIGQGGLGQLLLAGFNQDFLTPIVVSLVLSLLLSLVFDGLIARLGDWLTPWTE